MYSHIKAHIQTTAINVYNVPDAGIHVRVHLYFLFKTKDLTLRTKLQPNNIYPVQISNCNLSRFPHFFTFDERESPQLIRPSSFSRDRRYGDDRGPGVRVRRGAHQKGHVPHRGADVQGAAHQAHAHP